MVLSLRESVGLISDPRNLDASVEEVFHLMLGVNCTREDTPGRARPDSVTATDGVDGPWSGACVVRSGSAAPCEIAARMNISQDTVSEHLSNGIAALAEALYGDLADLRRGL